MILILKNTNIGMKATKMFARLIMFGSSGDMEASGACEMFLRSVESRSLKYTTLVGDGDTCLSAFGQSYLNGVL